MTIDLENKLIYSEDSSVPSHHDITCYGEYDPEIGGYIADSRSDRWCFVVPFLVEPRWDALLESHKNNTPIDISPEKWTPSSSGKMSITETENPDENGGVILKCTFGDGDKWCYPRVTVPEGIDLGEYSGVILRGRATGETTPRFFLHERDTGAGYMTEASLFPADGEWHAVRIPFDRLIHCGSTPFDPNGRLDLDNVITLSIGFNTKSTEATLEIGDCILIQP